jgi:hypothetical protein
MNKPPMHGPSAAVKVASPSAVRIINPANLLKQKMPLVQGSIDEVLARADQAVAHLEGEFEAGTELRINELQRVFREEWSRESTRAKAIKEFRRIAHDLKGEGSTFGYSLVTEVADLFRDYVTDTEPSAQKPEAIQTYLEAFLVVWGRRIKGNGGASGRAVIASLMQLNEKFQQGAI